MALLESWSSVDADDDTMDDTMGIVGCEGEGLALLLLVIWRRKERKGGCGDVYLRM